MNRAEIYSSVDKLLNDSLHVSDLEKYNITVLRAIGRSIALQWRHKQKDKDSVEAEHMIEILLQIRKLVHSKL